MRYSHNPTQVHAIQWTGENIDEILKTFPESQAKVVLGTGTDKKSATLYIRPHAQAISDMPVPAGYFVIRGDTLPSQREAGFGNYWFGCLEPKIFSEKYTADEITLVDIRKRRNLKYVPLGNPDFNDAAFSLSNMKNPESTAKFLKRAAELLSEAIREAIKRQVTSNEGLLEPIAKELAENAGTYSAEDLMNKYENIVYYIQNDPLNRIFPNGG